VYEIELDEDRMPAANPDVRALLDFGHVWNLLASGEIQEHAQITSLAHFVRHGYVNAEDEPKLQEI
jgi:hypothetical protein